MRRLLLEIVVTAVGMLLAVSALLALLPDEGSWASRAAGLVVAGATLDFASPNDREPILEVIVGAAGWSLAIVGTTALLLLLFGVPLGILSATRSRSVLVRVAQRGLAAVSSLPVLVWATLIFAVIIRGFGVELSADVNPVRTLGAAVLALLLGDRVLADLVQRVELRTVEILAEPYMRTVRAANLGVRRHLLQSLVPTIAESISSRAMFLIGGAIVAEYVFTIDGLGYKTIEALGGIDRRPELILALSMALVLIGLGFRFLTRTAAHLADPRHAT